MVVDKAAIPMCHYIRGAHSDAQHFAYYLEYLIFHLPENKILPALRWLIKNGIREQMFLDFIRHECKSSGLEFIRYLTMRLEKDTEMRPLYAKDLQ